VSCAAHRRTSYTFQLQIVRPASDCQRTAAFGQQIALLVAKMKVQRSIKSPLRADLSWEDKWAGADRGLIACWERGRQKAIESPDLVIKAAAGQLVSLPWKGGVETATKAMKKHGTLFYLAMWQGLRGDDLQIDVDAEVTLTCTVTGMRVTFTGDLEKYKNA